MTPPATESLPLENSELRARLKVKEELAASQQRFRALMEHSADEIILLDADGKIVSQSPNRNPLLGFTPGEMTGHDCFEFVHPDDLDAARRAFATLLAEPEAPLKGELRMRHKEGGWRWIRFHVGNLLHEPTVAALVLNLHDTTERTAAELRDSEERMRLATEATGVGIWEWHVPTGRIKWDAQMFRIYGLEPTEDGFVDYADWKNAVFPEDFARQEEILQDTYRQGGTGIREFRIRRRDNAERCIQAVDTVRANPNGPAEWFVGTNLDITERKQAEEALNRSEQFARSQWAETEAALEAIPANIAILDAGGVIVRVNTAWKSFCGQNSGSRETANTGANYLAVCESATGPAADDAQRFAAGIQRVIHGEIERFSMEYPCHSPTQQRWFIGYVTAARSEGTIARAVVAHVDITEQKRIEDQIRALNHELESRVIARTAKLRAAVEALQAEIDKRKLLEREILEISEREQSRFGQDLHDGIGQELAGIALLSNVLADKLQAEAHPLAKAAGDITTYIRDSIVSTRRLAKGLYPIELDRYGLLLALEDLANQTSLRFGIRCELKQTGDPPELEHSAPIHIYRIVQESIGNAIKHGKAGHIIIESAAGDGVHTFTITDDGSGFQKPSGKHGMGLNLMKYRARVIGAEISVERPEEGGCRITCRLPV